MEPASLGGQSGRDKRRRDPELARCDRWRGACGARIRSAEAPERSAVELAAVSRRGRWDFAAKDDGGPPQQPRASQQLRRLGYGLPGPVQRVPESAAQRTKAAPLGRRGGEIRRHCGREYRPGAGPSGRAGGTELSRCPRGLAWGEECGRGPVRWKGSCDPGRAGCGSGWLEAEG